MSEPLLVIVVGPIAAGKSTIAAALGDALRRHERAVAVLDLDEVVDTIGGFVDLPPERFHRAQMVFGQLVGSWLREGVDVIAHGPFFQREEDDALIHAVPGGTIVRRVYLHASIEVALERIRADPDRMLSSSPHFVRGTYERVAELRSLMPAQDCTFDTTATPVADIVDQLTEALVTLSRADRGSLQIPAPTHLDHDRE